MVRLAFLLPALFWALAATISAPMAHAENYEGDSSALQPAPAEDGSVMFVHVEVEGTRIELRQTRTADGTDRYDARPIIEHLRGQITLDDTVIEVLRFQDGARLSIDMADGKVVANDQALGLIPEWKAREAADTWLDANAIAILTGTTVQPLEDGTLSFVLDDRLRPQFDLELWVEGQRVTVGEVEPRTIGPVLLLPLRDVVDALGHTLEIDEETGLITVTRIQDTARIILDPNTGAVAVNDRFAGVSPSMSYAEPDILLFPSPAIETLTGSHITLRPGSNRVEIALDDRLGGGVLPDAYVLDQAKETPFTFERLEYEFMTEGQQTLVGYAHGGTLNGRGTLTTAGGLTTPGGLHPSTLTIDLDSLRGWRASVGDINSRFRELSGAGGGRVRGASWRRLTEDGDVVAVTAGVPLTGSRRLSDSASAPTFSGFAAGARLIRPDKQEEIGVSARSENGQSRIVASAQKAYQNDRHRSKAGLRSAQASIDLGAFQGGAASSFDVDAQAGGAYRLSSQSQLRVHGAYRGASFLSRRSSTLNETVEPEEAAARTSARASLDWRAVDDWTIIRDVGGAARVSTNRSGDQGSTTVGVSVGGQIANGGPSITADLSQSGAETDEGERASSTDLSLRAFKRFGWGDAQLTYQVSQAEAATASRMVATVNGAPVTRFLGKGAVVSLSPTASFVSSGDQTGGRLGAALVGDSGSAFGDRLRLGGQVSAAQSLNPEDSVTDVFASASASYYMNRYVQLTGSFGQSLSGNSSVFLALRGSAPFNPPRKHSLPKDGRGVLKGRAFLDRNRDGLRQEDEPGIPGIVIGLNQTRLRLAADRDGFFTIQNLKAGLYTLNVDRRTLPLGVMVADDTILRATVGAGQITSVDVPVIASGQLRGSVYIDADGSGAPSAGDTRLEGAFLSLKALDDDQAPVLEQFAASFGQFAFENLSPGQYTLHARFDGRSVERTITLNEDNLLMVDHVAFPAAPGPAPLDGGTGASGLVLATAP